MVDAFGNFPEDLTPDDYHTLCFNGQLMLPTDEDGAEYTVAGAPRVRIVADFPKGLNAAGEFTVHLADGSTQTFGALDGSAEVRGGTVAGDGMVRHWPLTRQEDRSGNSIHYSYSSSLEPSVNGDFTANARLASVEWHGGRVDFHYAEAPTGAPASPKDRRTWFWRGAKTRETEYLDSVEVFGAAGGLARTYELAYERSQSTGDLLLASVGECDRAGVCIPPTRFEYEDDESFASSGAVGPGLSPLRLTLGELQSLRTPDLNGDGLDDLLYVSDQPLTVLAGNETETYESPVRYVLSEGLSAYSEPGSIPFDTSNYQLRLADVDADGAPNILLVGGEVVGAGSGNHAVFRRIRDLRIGEGIETLANFGTISPVLLPGNCESVNGGPPAVCLANQLLDVATLDIDGDGADEILGCTRVYHAVPPQLVTSIDDEDSNAYWRVIGGFNSGGLPEPLPEPVFDTVCASECSGPTCGRRASFQTADVSGDGKADLLQILPLLPEKAEDLDPDTNYRYHAFGAQFPDTGHLPGPELTLPADLFQRYNRQRGEEDQAERSPYGGNRDLWGDLNGDGLADIVRFEPWDSGVWADGPWSFDSHFNRACDTGTDLPPFDARVSVYLNHGDGGFTRTVAEDAYKEWGDYCSSFQDAALADFDGDRLSELYLPDESEGAYRRALPVDGATSVEWDLFGAAPKSDLDTRRTFPFDLVGSGSPGLLTAATSGEAEGEYRVSISARRHIPDLLSKVTDGFGGESTLEYGSLYDSDTYLPLECPEYHRSLAPRRPMVRRVERLFDGDTAAVVSHRYRGSCHYVGGRDFASFQQHEQSLGVRIQAQTTYHSRVVEHRDNYDREFGRQVYRNVPNRIESFRRYPNAGRVQRDVEELTFVYIEDYFDRDLSVLDVGEVAPGVVTPKSSFYERVEGLGDCALDPLDQKDCDIVVADVLDASVTQYSDYSKHGIPQRIDFRRGDQCSVETLEYVDFEHSSLLEYALLQEGKLVSEGGGADGTTSLECDVTSPAVAPVRRSVSHEHDPETWKVSHSHWQEDGGREEIQADFTYEFGQLDGVTQTAVNPEGALGSTSDTRTWSRTFDATGIFVDSETDAMGATTSYSWHSDLALPYRVVSPDGVRVDTSFDGFGRERSVQVFGTNGTPASPPATRDYLRAAAAGGDLSLPSPMLVRENTPEGAETLTEYDEHREIVRQEWDVDENLRAFTRRTIVREPNRTVIGETLPSSVGGAPGAEGVTVLDPHGRVLSVDPPAADIGATTYHYEGLEARIESPLDDAVSYISNGAGLLAQATDERGVDTCYYYGGGGRLRDVVVNPELGVCDGSLPADSKSRTSTHFEYSNLGHPVYREIPGAGPEQNDFNAFGDVWRSATAAGTWSVVRDPLGRILNRIDSDGRNAQFEWENGTDCDVPVGALCRAKSSDDVVLEYEYDHLARLTSVRTDVDGVLFATGHGYDGFGRLAGTWHAGGPTIEYEYDAIGTPVAVSLKEGLELWRALEHDPLGSVTAAKYGNGAQLKQTYAEGLLRESVLDAPNMTPAFPGADVSSVTVDSLSLTYDASGRVETREIPHLQLAETFAYSGDQLEGAETTHSGQELGSWQQTYHPTGAIEWHSDLGEFEYGDSANPLGVTFAGGVEYKYGPHGRQAVRGSYEFSWNVRGRLTLAEGESRVEYAYDALDRRARKREETAKGEVEDTYYGQGEELKVADGVSRRTVYVSGPAGVVAALRSTDDFDKTEVLFLHGNEHGSSTVTTDIDGQVVQRQDFDAFGRRRPPMWKGVVDPDSLVADLDIGFTGHREEESYGLLDMGGRHYDPNLSRFASPDPFISDPLRAVGYDPFAYVLNRPLRFSDPSGFLAER